MKQVKIMLDAGHYGKSNRSAAVKAYYESDFTFKFCEMLKENLEDYGIVADMTREEQEKDLSLESRGKAAKGYDLFLSIHSNAVGNGIDNSVDYPVAITMINDEKVSIDEESLAIGEKLAQVVEEIMQTTQAARTYTRKSSNDRDKNGILDDEYYGVLNSAKSVGVPGIILEHSFHTNVRSANWLLDDDNLRRLAVAEAKALAKHYGISKEEPEQEWYRVRTAWNKPESQIGAYRKYENAVDGCPENYGVYNNKGTELYRRRTEYVVKSGDTLGKIAKKYGVSVDSIIEANRSEYPKITADLIRVGWKLVL